MSLRGRSVRTAGGFAIATVSRRPPNGCPSSFAIAADATRRLPLPRVTGTTIFRAAESCQLDAEEAFGGESTLARLPANT
jgi:hypothetical protein